MLAVKAGETVRVLAPVMAVTSQTTVGLERLSTTKRGREKFVNVALASVKVVPGEVLSVPFQSDADALKWNFTDILTFAAEAEYEVLEEKGVVCAG